MQTYNIQNLLELATRQTESPTLTLNHMQNFVEGRDDEIPVHILEILKKKESFIRDFVSRFDTWFSQDLGQIMEQELEVVLEEFRELTIDVEPATKVMALVNTRDLLIAIHAIIAEKEGPKEVFSVDSILKMINKLDIQMVGEKEIKNLHTNLEGVQSTSSLVDITYPKFQKLITDLEGYLWRLDVNMMFLKNKMRPDLVYKMLRTCPDEYCKEEIQKLTKRLKVLPLESYDEIQKYIDDFVSERQNQVEARRFIDKGIITEIQDEAQFKFVRLANKILLNDGKLTEAMAKQLINMGYGNSKMILRHQGKETAMKKQLDADNLTDGDRSALKLNEETFTQPHFEGDNSISNQPTKSISEERNDQENMRDEATQTETLPLVAEPMVQEALLTRNTILNEPTNKESLNKEAEGQIVEESFNSQKETVVPIDIYTQDSAKSPSPVKKHQVESNEIYSHIEAGNMEIRPWFKPQNPVESNIKVVTTVEITTQQEPLEDNIQSEKPWAEDVLVVTMPSLTLLPAHTPEQPMDEENPITTNENITDHIANQGMTEESFEERESTKLTFPLVSTYKADIVEPTPLQTLSPTKEAPLPVRRPSISTQLKDNEPNSTQVLKALVQKQSKVTYEEALECLTRNVIPDNYEGTLETFVSNMEYIEQSRAKSADPHIDLYYLRDMLHKLNHLQIEYPDIKSLQALQKRLLAAMSFRDTVIELLSTPDELVNKQTELEAIQATLGVEVPEFYKVQEEIKRDAETAKEVKAAIEKREHMDLHNITLIKNKDQAARYFKDPVQSLKIYDIFIMALIAAWKDHDHEKGEIKIDYLTLKEVYSVVRFTDDGKSKYIKPDNAEFIKRMFEKVKVYIQNEVSCLTLNEILLKNPERSYKRFIDLTGRFIDHTYKLQEKASSKGDQELLRKKTFKPSGKESMMNKTIDFEHHQGEYSLSKPGYTNKITILHRRFYVSSWMYYLRNNPYIIISSRKAFKVAVDFEKSIYASTSDNTIEYERECDILLKTLDKMCCWKYISRRARSKVYDIEFLNRFKNLGVQAMTDYNRAYKKFYVELKQMKKTKEQKTSQENGVADANKDSSRVANKETMDQEHFSRANKKNRQIRRYKEHTGPRDQNRQSIPIEQNYDIEVKPSSLVMNNYHAFRLFEGSLVVKMSNNNTHKIDNVRVG